MKSINDIDFSGCVLPEWQRKRLRVYLDQYQSNDSVKIAFGGYAGWIARRANGEWKLATDGATIPELDQLHTICAQVDKFIETELDRLNAPEWVNIKPSEAERLHGLGVEIQWKWAHGWTPYRGKGSCGNAKEFQANAKTVPVGVALYEPEWVDVDWRDVERLSRPSVTVEASDTGPGGPWWSCNHPCGVDVTKTQYRADRKTFPPGFELTKAEPKRDVPKCWEAVDFDAFTAKTKTGLDLVLKTNLVGVYLCSKETRIRIMQRERDHIWETDEGARGEDEPGMADLFAICKRVDEHIEKALKPKPEPFARETVEMSADEFLRMLVNVPGPARWASYRNGEGKFYVFRCGSGFFKAATADGGGETRVDMCHFFQVGPYRVEVMNVDGKDGGTWVPSGPLYVTGVNASGCEIKSGDAVAVKTLTDWTVGADGRCNTSEEFVRLTTEVARLIHDSAHSLICGQALSVAQLIMAQLAHKQGMRPPAKIEPEKDVLAWLPCAREEAEANQDCSQILAIGEGTSGAWRDTLISVRIDGFKYQYRTRAKLDRWVKVPWTDVGRLVIGSRAVIEFDFVDSPTGWSHPEPGHVVTESKKYRADRSTLPACYVLGVGFVEQS